MAQENKVLSENTSDREIVSTRIFDASRETLFKAFANPDELAQWWGPKGFTTTIQEFDFRPGGTCRLILHGPNGADYHNEKVFVEIIKPERIVFRHLQPMHDFEMAMIFSETGGKTKLTWRMVFESVEACAKIRRLITEANEQNYDRLEAFLKKTTDGNQVMTKGKTPVEDTSDREIVVSRTFDAPRELVWQAMTDPEHVVHWWGPRGFTTTVKTMDVRAGGVWVHTMHGPDGTNYPNKSVFKEVIKPERIVYSHGGGRENGPGAHFVATWSFEAQGKDKTKLTIQMVFPSKKDRDFVVKEFGALEGAKQTLERLSEHLPKMGGVSADMPK